MYKLLFLFFLSAVTIKGTHYQEINYVPNEETAIAVGVAILTPIFKEDVKKYKYKAFLQDSNTWVVYGTLRGKPLLGGIPCIKIQKSDCKVIAIDGGK